MTLSPDQQKRFEEQFVDVLAPNGVRAVQCLAEELEKFLASELQLERERLLMAFHESQKVFFREHDLKPCECLMRYVERFLKSL